MDKFVIEGGYPLSGTVVPAGNKNAALPMLAACLLTEEEVVLGNVPRIRDVDAMLALLEDLGVSVSWRDEHEVALRASSLRSSEVDAGAGGAHPRVVPARRPAGRARSARRTCRRPGGDFIGRRRLDPHLDALRALGAQVHVDRGYEMWAPNGLRACEFFMDEASVMATENALMAAALTQGTTTIRNAASRAARAGPGAAAGRDGRAHRRHRLERPGRPRAQPARRRARDDRARPHRGRQLHGAGRRHRRRDAHQGHRPGRPARWSAWCSSGSGSSPTTTGWT